ncbi:MAG: hypothetical protein AAFQ60_08145 [Pseudomonadota bacterium]
MFGPAFSKIVLSALTSAVVVTGLSLSPAIAGEGGDGGGKGGAKAKIATNEQAALYNPKAR